MAYRVTIAGTSKHQLDAGTVAALAPRFAEQRGQLHSDGGHRFVATFEVRSEQLDPLDAVVFARRWLRPVIEPAAVDHVEAIRTELAEPGPDATKAPLDLVGVAEVAEMLGITKQAVAKKTEPAPIVRLKSGPVWHRTDWSQRAV